MRLNPWLLVAAMGVCLLTARLGWWQLDRAAQKLQLQQSLDERRALPALRGTELPAQAADVAAARHRVAVLEGRWVVDGTIYLDNRPMNARTGFYVVTPLLLDDGTAVLVQRGWLPRDLQDRTRLAPFSTPAGRVEVKGRIAPALARLYEFDAAASGPIRQNLDIDAHARETRLALRPWAVVQEAEAAGPADGLLRQWPALSTGVHKHYGYAFQWFSLCALTVVLYAWFQFIRPRRSPRR
jgi:surfeit locus 1 family protein